MGNIGPRKIGVRARVRVSITKQLEAIFKAFISTELGLSGHVFIPQAITSTGKPFRERLLIQRSADGEDDDNGDEDDGAADDDDDDGELRFFLRRRCALALLASMRAWMVGVRR